MLLLESAPKRGRALRASTWHPPTLDLLDELGLAAPLVAHGHVTPTWQVRMHPSGERAVFGLGVLAGESRHPYRLQCEQQVYCELVESRPRIVPATRAAAANPASPHGAASAADGSPNLTWARRLKRVFGIDLETCRQCGGRLRVIA